MRNKTEISFSCFICVSFASFLFALVLPFFVEGATCKLVPWDTGNTDHQIAGYTVSGRETASQFTVASDCTVTAIGMVWFRTAGHSDDPRVRLYDGSGGFPNNLLETGSTGSGVPVAASTAWATSTFAGTTLLTAGTTYWASCAPATSSGTDEEDCMISSTNATSKTWNNINWSTFTPNFANNSVAMVIEGSQSGGGTATTTPVATSTIDQTQRNMWNAYFAFFSMFCLVLWMGRSTR